MCKCLEEKRQLVVDSAKDKLSNFQHWTIESAEFKHTTELFVSNLNIPIVVKGLNSKGNKSKKELYYPILYCPFCGEKVYND